MSSAPDPAPIPPDRPGGPLALLRALRPHQWSKNVFVLGALVFAAGDRMREVGGPALVGTLLAFAAFCMASSAVYLLNDVLDVEKDRAHPEKKKRPIAAGEVSVQTALATAVLLALGALAAGTAAADGGGVVLLLVLYVAMNLAYSFYLKSVVLVDSFCIATGFLFRVKTGGIAADVDISHWAFLVTLFLALFLALNKRRAEMTLLGDEMSTHRPNLSQYSVAFLDQMVGVLAACTIVAYTMYTVDMETINKFGSHNLVWTVPFVVFGLGRYMVLVQTGTGGDNPTKILLGGDLWFFLNLAAWGATVVYVLFLD